MPRPPNYAVSNLYHWALIGLVFGALYWILDTTVDALFFEDDTGFIQVLFPTGMKLWVRGSVMVLAVTLSIYAGSIIAKQDRSHEALRRSNERFRFIAENIPGVVYSFDSHSESPRRAVFLGPGMSTLIGNSAASDVRENVDLFFDLIHPDDRAALEQVGDLDKSSNRPIDQQYRLRTESGDYKWVRSIGQALTLADSWTRWHGVLIDISEQKRTEQALQQAHDELEHRVKERTAELSAATERATKELDQRQEADMALRESEQRFRQMAENLDEVLWLTDWKKKTLLYVNRAYETMFGRSCQSLYQDRRSWTEVIHPEDRDRVTQAFARKAALGEDAEEEYRIVRVDGSVRWLRDRAFPIRDQAGEIYRIVGVAEDITERKKNEQELQKRSELERLLFGELDHRIRNNLASLITLIDMTSRSGEDVEEFANSMKHRIMGMAHVHSLLSQSHWRPITLRQLVETLTAADYPGTIILQGSEVLISPRQTTGLGVVINELMMNSLKHGALQSPQGRVEISWELQQPKEKALRLLMTWREVNGPALAPQPKPNVGSRIIEGIMRSELGGKAQMTYPPHGAHHRFEIALDTVEEMLPAAEVVTGTTLPERS